MCDSNSANEMLEVIGQVLIWCFIIGVFVLFFWWGALALMGILHTVFTPRLLQYPDSSSTSFTMPGCS
jgi:hypothetical protein